MMAALTARRRKALPSSKFALLGKGTGMGGAVRGRARKSAGSRAARGAAAAGGRMARVVASRLTLGAASAPRGGARSRG